MLVYFAVCMTVLALIGMLLTIRFRRAIQSVLLLSLLILEWTVMFTSILLYLCITFLA